MPWIFRDTNSYLKTGTIPPPPTIQEKCELMRAHFYHIMRFRTEWCAVGEFRKRISWYAKQMHPCRMLKDDVRVINSPADFDSAIARFLEWRLKHDEDVRAGRAKPIYEGELVEAA